MKRRFGFLPALIAILVLCESQTARAAYADVPKGALGNEVRKAVEYGLMNGLSENRFGYAVPMTREQFVTVLDRLLLSDADSAPLPDSMKLPDTLSEVRRQALSHAVAYGVVDSSVPFRPDAPVTRQEMAEMLVKALGLDNAALSLSSNRILTFHSDKTSLPDLENATPFRDLPEGKEGYAAIAYAIGMTKGLSPTRFGPNDTATRAQVAAMLTRIYEKLHQRTSFRHAFYSSSHMLSASAVLLDVISVEWSRMSWNEARAVLVTKPNSTGPSDRVVPSDYETIAKALTAHGAKLHLSVFMNISGGLETLLSSNEGRAEAVQQILNELTVPYPALGKNPYSGVTIDFKGLHKEQRPLFTRFLSELKDALSQTGKGLYVCVPPYLSAGHWDDGYDYRAIVEMADRLILTAYNYQPDSLNNFLGTEAYKNVPPAPLSNVYLSLWKLAEEIPDTFASKLVLGVTSQHTAWEVGRDNDNLLSGSPVLPDTEALRQYLNLPDTKKGWSVSYQMPYAFYRTPQGSRYFVWYENNRSFHRKAEIARLLGVTAISYWRIDLNPLYAPWESF